MRMAFTVFALGLCTLTTGCRIAVHFARNLAYEPMRYTDDVVECYRNERLACAAWNDVTSGNRDKVYSKDYQRGFKDGYADYLRYRGPGTPPPVPPKCYWNQHYQTPGGHAAIEDWYAGFMHGANAARESWRAPFLTVPTHAEGPDPVRAPMPADAPASTGDVLPPPAKEKPMEPAKKEPVKEPAPTKKAEGSGEDDLTVIPLPSAQVVPLAQESSRMSLPPLVQAIEEPVRVATPPRTPLSPPISRPPEPTFRGTPYPVVHPRPATLTPAP